MGREPVRNLDIKSELKSQYITASSQSVVESANKESINLEQEFCQRFNKALEILNKNTMVRSQILSNYPKAENNQVVRAPDELD